MAKIKKIADVLEVAVRIERQGVEFYNRLYSIIESTEAKDIFSFLAAEEERHCGCFRQLLNKVADYTPKFKYPGEYELFLDGIAARALASFKKGKEAMDAKDFTEAIAVGINLEKESISFYEDVMKQFNAPELSHIQEVIKDEKAHLAKLESLKNKLSF